MARLAISLFGCFRATRDGIPLTGFVSDKGRALLAYLAIESDRPHRRSALAALLWPDRPEAVALANLRQTLHRMRQSIAYPSSDSLYFLITPQEIQLNCESDYWLDVTEFDQTVSGCQRHHPHGTGLCEDCLERLQSAIELYKGDLLAGFFLPDCPQFEWWLLSRQEKYHRQAIDTLDGLARHWESIQVYSQVSRYAQRVIELEPWREVAHRQKMRALALCGQHRAALRQYEICCQILADELGVEPAPKTTRLFQQIKAGTLQAGVT